MQLLIYVWEEIKWIFLNLMEVLDWDTDRKRVLDCIDVIRDNFHWNPAPPLAKPLSGQGDSKLNEFRISLNIQLIRIHYFIDKQKDIIVILNYYIKPNGTKDKNAYIGKAWKKLQKYIQTQISLARDLQEKYLLNQDDYELLN